MENFEKPIEVEMLVEASEYFYKLPINVQRKFLSSFEKTCSGFKGEWFSKLESTDGIFEFRQRDTQKFYRLLAFWYGEESSKTLIVCTQGFDKKSNKTPKNEIEKAERLKKQYYLSKSEEK